MSWSEVKKINSDFAREPLNFNNYINDISIFGSRSYVLDVENSSLWRDLIVNSLAMFGHDAIHETVYNRFTDEDVDYMIRTNGQLGQSFNSFYSVTNFTSGGIDTVLGMLDVDAYDILEPKFKSGIYRYISEKTKDDNAGNWLGTIYNNDELKAKTDIASIVSDADLWTRVIMNNPAMRRVISISETTVQWFAANPSDVYTDFINEVCHNTDATMTLFTSLSLVNGITDFMNTESVVTVLANNRESMVATTFMIEPFAAMIASEVAMNAVVTSDVAIEVVISSITNVANSETVLDGIDENLAAILELLPSIADTEPVIAEVGEAKAHVVEITDQLGTVSSQTHTFINNIHDLLNNSTAMNAVAASETAMNAVAASETAMNAVLASETAMNAVAASETAMNAVAASETAMNAVLASETAMNAVLASETAMNAVYSSNVSLAKFVAYRAGCDYTNYKSMDELVSSGLMVTITNSPIAMNAVAKSKLDWSDMKSFITLINGSGYLKNVYNSCTNATYFTTKLNKGFDNLKSADQYGSKDYAKNSIIFTRFGYYEDASSSAQTNVYVNGKLFKSGSSSSSNPSSITVSSQIHAVSIPVTTWTETGDAYIAVRVCTAI